MTTLTPPTTTKEKKQLLVGQIPHNIDDDAVQRALSLLIRPLLTTTMTTSTSSGGATPTLVESGMTTKSPIATPPTSPMSMVATCLMELTPLPITIQMIIIEYLIPFESVANLLELQLSLLYNPSSPINVIDTSLSNLCK
jgi:hypothetical protein